jgi:Fic family protein
MGAGRRGCNVGRVSPTRGRRWEQRGSNDLTYFFSYQLDVLHRAIGNLNAYLARKVEEAQAVRKQLQQTETEFNARQLALVYNAMNNPKAQSTVDSHMRAHRIGAEAARKDLAELHEKGLLGRLKVGKRYQYQAAHDLADRLKA